MRLQWSSTDLRGSEDPSIKRSFLGSCEEGDRGYCERKNGNIETARAKVKNIQKKWRRRGEAENGLGMCECRNRKLFDRNCKKIYSIKQRTSCCFN